MMPHSESPTSQRKSPKRDRLHKLTDVPAFTARDVFSVLPQDAAELLAAPDLFDTVCRSLAERERQEAVERHRRRHEERQRWMQVQTFLNAVGSSAADEPAPASPSLSLATSPRDPAPAPRAAGALPAEALPAGVLERSQFVEVVLFQLLLAPGEIIGRYREAVEGLAAEGLGPRGLLARRSTSLTAKSRAAMLDQASKAHDAPPSEWAASVHKVLRVVEGGQGGRPAVPFPSALLCAWAEDVARLFDAADPRATGRMPWADLLMHMVRAVSKRDTEERRKLFTELTLETKGGSFDVVAEARALQAQLQREGLKQGGPKDTLVVAAGAGSEPIVLSPHVPTHVMHGALLSYVAPHRLWSVLESYNRLSAMATTPDQTLAAANTPLDSRGGCVWRLVDDTAPPAPTSGATSDAIVIVEVIDHGVSACVYVDELDEFVFASRKQSIFSYAYRTTFAPVPPKKLGPATRSTAPKNHNATVRRTTPAGDEQVVTSLVEPKRRPAHFPHDVAVAEYAAPLRSLLFGTLAGAVVVLPVADLGGRDGLHWNVPTLLVLPCHAHPVVSLSVMPKFARAIAGSFFGAVAQTDLRPDGQVRFLPRQEERAGGVRAILAIPDKHLLLTAGHATIAVWSLSLPATATAGHSVSNASFLGTLQDPSSPHIPPIIALWRAPDRARRNPILEKKVLSVDGSGAVKVWDVVERCCVVTCRQPRPFKCLGACMAVRYTTDTVAGRVTRDAKRARRMRDEFLRRVHRKDGGIAAEAPEDAEAEDLLEVRVKMVGIDVDLYRLELRETVTALGDDFSPAAVDERLEMAMVGSATATSMAEAATMQDINRLVQDVASRKGRDGLLSDLTRQGRNLVLTGRSLDTDTHRRHLHAPQHVGSFFMPALGAIASVTDNYIIMIDRRRKHLMARYTNFGHKIAVAAVGSAPTDDAEPKKATTTASSSNNKVTSNSTSAWAYGKHLFLAVEGANTVLVVDASTGEVSLELHMTRAAPPKPHTATSILLLTHRGQAVVGTATGVLAIFSLPDAEHRKAARRTDATAVLYPIAFVACSPTSVTAMAYHAAADMVAVGDADGNVQQWEVTQGSLALSTRLRQPPLRGGSATTTDNDDLARIRRLAARSGTEELGGQHGSSSAAEVNFETDKHMYQIISHDVCSEVTAIASLSPVRAFVVADSASRLAIWVTAPYDEAVVAFAWDHYTPRWFASGVAKSIVTSMAIDTSSSIYVAQCVDDQGGYVAWSLGSALLQCGLMHERRSARRLAGASHAVKITGAMRRKSTAARRRKSLLATPKWQAPADDAASSPEAGGEKRLCAADLVAVADAIPPPALLYAKTFTLAPDVPLTSVELLAHDRDARNRVLVGVSNGDSLIATVDGDIRSVLQPMVRKATGRRTINQEVVGGPAGKHAYNCEEALSDDEPVAGDSAQNGAGPPSRGLELWALARRRFFPRRQALLLRATVVPHGTVLGKAPARLEEVDARLVRPTLAPPPSPSRFQHLEPAHRFRLGVLVQRPASGGGRPSSALRPLGAGGGEEGGLVRGRGGVTMDLSGTFSDSARTARDQRQWPFGAQLRARLEACIAADTARRIEQDPLYRPAVPPQLHRDAPPSLYEPTMTIAYSSPPACAFHGLGEVPAEDTVELRVGDDDDDEVADPAHLSIAAALDDAVPLSHAQPRRLLLDGGDWAVFRHLVPLEPLAVQRREAVSGVRFGGRGAEHLHSHGGDGHGAEPAASVHDRLSNATTPSRRSPPHRRPSTEAVVEGPSTRDVTHLKASMMPEPLCRPPTPKHEPRHATPTPLTTLLRQSAPFYPLCPSPFLVPGGAPSILPGAFGVPDVPDEDTDGSGEEVVPPADAGRPTLQCGSPFPWSQRPTSAATMAKRTIRAAMVAELSLQGAPKPVSRPRSGSTARHRRGSSTMHGSLEVTVDGAQASEEQVPATLLLGALGNTEPSVREHRTHARAGDRGGTQPSSISRLRRRPLSAGAQAAAHGTAQRHAAVNIHVARRHR